MAAVPLSRPELPVIAAPLEWPGRVLAIFGPGELELARSIANACSAPLMRPLLRHAPGFRINGELIYAHPNSLLEALAQARPEAPLSIGVGGAFALAVRATTTIWLTGGEPTFSLPAPLRQIAQRADLALEEPRAGLAEELANRLRSGT